MFLALVGCLCFFGLAFFCLLLVVGGFWSLHVDGFLLFARMLELSFARDDVFLAVFARLDHDWDIDWLDNEDRLLDHGPSVFFCVHSRQPLELLVADHFVGDRSLMVGLLHHFEQSARTHFLVPIGAGHVHFGRK